MTIHQVRDVGKPRRRRLRTSVALAAAGILAAVTLTACGGGSSDDADGKNGGTLTVGIPSLPGSLNPAVDAGASGPGFYLHLPYATLVERSPEDGTYGAGLAETFGYLGDGNQTYELKLRPDLKFADGSALDSKAVKSWLEYFPTQGSGHANLLNIASIDTPDAVTVRLNLGSPSPSVSEALSTTGWGMVISSKAVADKAAMAAGAPGAGPFMYDPKKSVAGANATYTLVPNKYYWDKKQIHWDKVVVKVVADPATMLRSLQSGQLDVGMGTVSTVAAAKKAGLNVSTASAGYDVIQFVDYGSTVKALGDVRVRQALNYAVDRDAIVESLYDGQVKATSAPFMSDLTDKALMDTYPYDPEKAKELLDEAGYADGFSFKVVSLDASTGPLMQAIAQNWSDIGVKADIVSTTTTQEFVEKFTTQSAFATPTPAISVLTLVSATFTPASPLNPTKFEDTVITDLFAQAQTATPDALPEIANQITRQITEQAYSVPVATNIYSLYSTDKVKGVESGPFLPGTPAIRAWTAK